MKIFIISANWGHGGPGGVASDIYNVCKKNGHDCCFVYGRESIPEDVKSYRVGKKIDVYGHLLEARLFDNMGFGSRRATNKLILEIEKVKPDIICIHNQLGYVLNVRILFEYIKNSKILTFWTLHDCWALTGHCITGLCEKFGKGCGKCPRKKEYPKSLFLDKSYRNMKKKQKIFGNISNLVLITPSKWLANLVQQSYLKNNELHVIPNGIDLNVFVPTESDYREKHGWQNRVILLSVAGKWEKTKGAEYIYQLTEMLEDKYVFVMIGYNEDKELKYNKRIMHIARTEDRSELAKWYTVADVFVNPTMGDNFPTVNLEALACGTPVVTFNTGGSPESVGECGGIAPAGNVQLLKEEIEKCIARKIGKEQCLEQVQNYDKNVRYEEYLDLFSRRYDMNE